MDIEIYSAEKDIAHLIKQNSVISHLVELKEVEPFEISEKLQASINKEGATRQNFDLHHLQSLLVTSVLNGNDDYFLPNELYLARNTAKDKPFNVEHECDDIIGHITNSYVIDNNGNKIEDGVSLDKLPDIIHIVAQAVLYKHWSKEDKQERMNQILDELKSNKWFVSVECLFPTFDYILIDEGGTNKLIARNDKTAFLTKYLRVYQGVGVYQGKKIGRVPRNFIISGKGLVKEPANKPSIIFAKKYEISKNKLELVYQTQEVIQMDNDKELQYKDSIKKLETELLEVKASVTTNKFKELEKKLEEANKTLEDANKSIEVSAQEVNALKASLEGVNKDKLALAKSFDELQAQKKEIEDKLNKIENDNKALERLNICKAKLGMNDEEAKSFSESLNLFDNDKFNQFIEMQSKFIQSKASVTTPVVETKVVDTKVLEKVEGKKTDPDMNVTTPAAPTRQEQIQKLSASLADYMEKREFRKTVEPKFKS